MYKIIKKRELNSTVTMMDIYAPLVAKKAQAGEYRSQWPVTTEMPAR